MFEQFEKFLELWTDETKVVRFDHAEKQFAVW